MPTLPVVTQVEISALAQNAVEHGFPGILLVLMSLADALDKKSSCYHQEAGISTAQKEAVIKFHYFISDLEILAGTSSA